MLGWRAWYEGERTFSSTSTEFQALPESGVLVLAEYRATGKTIWDGADWYYLEDGAFGYVASKAWGTDEPRPDLQCRSCVKEGVGVSDAEFWEAHRQAWRSEWP